MSRTLKTVAKRLPNAYYDIVPTYTAIATLKRMAPPTDDLIEDVIARLREVGGTLAVDEWQRIQIMCTIESPTIGEAMDIARVLLAPWPDQVKVELLDEAEVAAWGHPQNYATVTEVAEHFGVSRQSILKRIHRGTLPARRKGNKWVVSRTAMV